MESEDEIRETKSESPTSPNLCATLIGVIQWKMLAVASKTAAAVGIIFRSAIS